MLFHRYAQFDDYLNKDDDDPVTDVVTFAQAVETANLAKRDKEQGKSQPEAAAGSNSGRGSDVGAETVAESAVQIEGGTTTGAKASSDDGQPSTTDAAAANADTAPATMNSQTTSGTADTEPDSEEKTSAKDKKDKQKANPKQRKAKNKKEVDNEVVTLSSLNVKEILRPSNRRADVFLLFHRKGCPLCRTLKDEFRRTANAFKDVSVSIPCPIADPQLGCVADVWHHSERKVKLINTAILDLCLLGHAPTLLCVASGWRHDRGGAGHRRDADPRRVYCRGRPLYASTTLQRSLIAIARLSLL